MRKTKLIVLGLALITTIFASVNAELLTDFGWVNGTSVSSATQFGGTTKTTCFYTITGPESDGCGYSFDGTNYYSMGGDNLICVYGVFYMRCTNRSHTFRIFSTENIVAPSSKCQSSYSLLTQNQCNSQYSGYILPSNCPSSEPMTSLQCQTEYSLIPIENVTANYCALNFGMIDPQECPINSGTGAIVRSNLMINDVPYAQNQNINVFIPDFLSWNLSYNDLYTVIEVEGYNADEEYIENVINNEKLTPTNEDIEEMLTGFMTNYFPYLALAIVFIYLARKIFKIFK